MLSHLVQAVQALDYLIDVEAEIDQARDLVNSGLNQAVDQTGTFIRRAEQGTI